MGKSLEITMEKLEDLIVLSNLVQWEIREGRIDSVRGPDSAAAGLLAAKHNAGPDDQEEHQQNEADEKELGKETEKWRQWRRDEEQQRLNNVVIRLFGVK